MRLARSLKQKHNQFQTEGWEVVYPVLTGDVKPKVRESKVLLRFLKHFKRPLMQDDPEMAQAAAFNLFMASLDFGQPDGIIVGFRVSSPFHISLFFIILFVRSI